MNGAEYLIESLIKNGTDTVFGYPGATVLSIYDALYKHRNEIRHVRCAHEQASSHAADGYARVSGRTGVCISTSGPGATNLVTGIANAFMDSIPVVFITGNVELPLVGTDSFQEVDITGITLPVTKHNYIVKSFDELETVIDEAFFVANDGRKGPVLVDIPKDILEGNFKPKNAPHSFETREFPCENISSEDISACIDKSKRPLILVGSGVINSGAGNEVLELAKKIKAPICSSLMGVSLFAYNEPMYLGYLGAMGNINAHKAFVECDTLIAIGTRLSNRTLCNIENKTLIHIDRDKSEINKISNASYYAVGDAKVIVRNIIANTQNVSERPWTDVMKTFRADEIKNISTEIPSAGRKTFDYQDVFNAISEAVGPNSIVVTDVGQHQMMVAGKYHFTGTDKLITSGGLGTMGFGLGAAIGAKIANPDKNVVLITGDGSFNMMANELDTLMREQIAISIVVCNNKKLGMVYDIQDKHLGGRHSETRIARSVDFTRLARAYKINGTNAREIIDISRAIIDGINSNTATLVNVPTR